VAKIVAYKFVNPGGRSVRSSGGIAARKQLLAVNRVGASTSSLATTLSDIAKINTAFKRTETEIEKQQRRKLQRERDNQAEELQEGKSIEKGKVDGEFKKEIKKKPKGGLVSKAFKAKNGFFGFLEGFLSPIGCLIMKIAAKAIFANILLYLSDPKKSEEVKVFIEKASFVFKKLYQFGSMIVGSVMDTVGQVVGKESTLSERLIGLGKIIGAITGMTLLLEGVGMVRDLFNTAEDVADTVDTAKDVKRAMRTQKTVKELGEQFGQKAGKRYAMLIADGADDAAELFAKTLRETGDIKQANKAVKAFTEGLDVAADAAKVAKQPGFFSRMMSKGKNFAVTQGQRGLNFATTEGKKLLELGSTALQNLAARFPKVDIIGALKSLPDKTVKKYKQVAAWGAQAMDNAKAGINSLTETIGKGFNNLGKFAQEQVLGRLYNKFKPFFDGISDVVKPIISNFKKNLLSIPGMEKAPGVLKKMGINGFGDISKAGSKLGARASSFLPLIGSIANFLFAYQRLSQGDTIGALIEGGSGAIQFTGELATVTGVGAAPGLAAIIASYAGDGYMFLRDFIPEIQENEEKAVGAMGLGGIKKFIDQAVSKVLPGFGAIMKAATGDLEGAGEMYKDQSNYAGQGSMTEQTKEPIDVEDPISISTKGKVSGRFDMETGKGYINDREVPMEEYEAFANMSMAEKLAKYSKAAGGLVGSISAVKGSLTAVKRIASSKLSEEISIAKEMAEAIVVPMVIQQLAPMPMLVPINSGDGNTASISSVTSRRL